MYRKLWYCLAVVCGLFVAAVAPCSAQYPTPEQTGLNYAITAGAAFPVGSDVDSDASFIVGVSWYDAASDELGGNSAIGITGDWILVQRDAGDESIIPVLLNYRRYGAIGNWRVFVNFGLGILAISDDIPEMRLDSGAEFGWTGGLGVDITNNLYFQSRFIGGPHPGDDGIATVELGYRF